MHAAHIARPVIQLAPHRVTTQEIIDDITAAHPGHPRLRLWARYIANSGVETRYWNRPLAETAAPTNVAERTEKAFGDALEAAEVVARKALAESGLAPADVDAIVTSHTSSYSVPSLDVHLVERLGLRPTVARLPLTTTACAGGAQALIRAALHTRAVPGTRVLVVVSETLSTIYHRTETSSESMIYKALFGDAAAATIVTDATRPDPAARPGGFLVHDVLEAVMPASLDRYWGVMREDGIHFESTKAAARAADDAMPLVTQWLDGRRPQWAVIHPGGPRIIHSVATHLDLDPETDARHSTASLTANGNLGGAAVLDVLRRTHNTPPAPGTPGVMAAFGPGFTVAALHGAWT